MRHPTLAPCRPTLAVAFLAVSVILCTGACAHIPTRDEIVAECRRTAPHDQATFANCVYSGIAQAEMEVERRRRILLAIGTGMQAVGQGMSQSSYRRSPPSYSPPPARYRSRVLAEESRCRSDFECGIGRVCVKPPYSYTGTCAIPVNEYGTPVPGVLRHDSIGPGEPKGQCSWDSDCPVGFRCTKANGQLYGHCMR